MFNIINSKVQFKYTVGIDIRLKVTGKVIGYGWHHILHLFRVTVKWDLQFQSKFTLIATDIPDYSTISVVRDAYGAQPSDQEVSQNWTNNEEIEIFREYLRIPTVHPNVNYSKNGKAQINR